MLKESRETSPLRRTARGDGFAAGFPSPFERMMSTENRPATSQVPDESGRYGRFGGRFVPETLTRALEELDSAYNDARRDPSFEAEFQSLLTTYVGRPSPLYFAQRLTESCGGAQIWLKREDVNHTGAHKINNTLGQALLTQRMGKQRVIAETGAGQHGVATATACARFGIPCTVYMGEEDVRRQAHLHVAVREKAEIHTLQALFNIVHGGLKVIG